MQKLFKYRYSDGSTLTGLGLYIAKSIVEMHGGEIKAYNLAEGGACIEF